jgi:hypothetical protein
MDALSLLRHRNRTLRQRSIGLGKSQRVHQTSSSLTSTKTLFLTFYWKFRMASKAPPQGQSLVEIAEYHNDATDALHLFLGSLYRNSNARFLGYSPSEFNGLLLSRVEETELRSSLAILAAVEATIRIDYQLRATRRYKDPRSREFRSIFKERRERARLDEDLLESWSRHSPSCKRLVGELRAALHFRHWLAHGRYWERPKHRRFDYQSIYGLAELMLIQFPFYRN